MIPVNIDGQKAIRELIHFYRKENNGKLDPKQLLFRSREGENKAISRTQAHCILKDAFEKAGLTGKVATHSMRKTFAQNIWDSTKNPNYFAELMGHKSWGGLDDYVIPPTYEDLKENIFEYL